MKSNIRFLKSGKLWEFLVLESKWFHSMAVKRRKNFFFEKSRLTLWNTVIMPCHIHLSSNWYNSGVLGILFYYYYKKETKFPGPSWFMQRFYSKFFIKFPLELPLVAPVIGYSTLSRKEILNVWSYKMSPYYR